MGSGLGVALGMSASTIWNTVVSKIRSVVNRGPLNWSPSSNTSYSVPAGYYSGGTLSSANAYNAGYNAGTAAGYKIKTGTIKMSTSTVSAFGTGFYYADLNPGGMIPYYVIATVSSISLCFRTASMTYIGFSSGGMVSGGVLGSFSPSSIRLYGNQSGGTATYYIIGK